MLEKHKGKHALKITLLDGTNKQALPLRSLDRKVNVDNDLIKELELEGLKYKVN
jgi:hypothetical protein